MSEKRRYSVTLDDDPLMGKIIEQATGLKTVCFDSAARLLDKISSMEPIAVFVDIHLGKESGLELIPVLRARWIYCPLIVITGDAADSAVEKALTSGANDFVMKPFRPGELKARLQIRLQDLAEKEAKNIIRMGDVVLDCSHRVLKTRTGTRYLSETQVSLIKCLWNAQATVVPRDTLKWHGWGEVAVSDGAVDKRLHEIRGALQDVGSSLTLNNVYREGFSLKVATKPTEPTQSQGRTKMKRKPRSSTQKNEFSELFDQAKLQSLVDLTEKGGPDFLSELGAIFLTEAPRVFAAMQDAVQRGDATALRQSAHKLKGMCFNIAAQSLANYCEKLEGLGLQGSVFGAKASLEDYQRDFQLVARYFQQRGKQAA